MANAVAEVWVAVSVRDGREQVDLTFAARETEAELLEDFGDCLLPEERDGYRARRFVAAAAAEGKER